MDLTQPHFCPAHNSGTGELLPAANFHIVKNRLGKPTFDSYCKECRNKDTLVRHRKNAKKIKAHQQKFRKANPNYFKDRRKALPKEVVKKQDAKKNFAKMGATPEWYEAELIKQGGHCVFCDREKEDDGRRLSIDHNHLCCSGRKPCGKCKRGIVCQRHNQLLGYLEQAGETLITKMFAYIKEYALGT